MTKTSIYGRLAWGVACLSLCAVVVGFSTLPKDGANARTVRFDNMHLVRYLEIFVFGGNENTGKLRANVYNTSLVRGFDPKTNKDSAPPSYVTGLNVEATKKQFDALAVTLSGPKLWMFDWFDVPLGVDREFNGKNIPWCAELHLERSELEALAKGETKYKPTTSGRKSVMGYNKGTTVFLIDDVDGNTWIMKGFELGLKPRWTYEEFATDPASHFKQLPAGWKFRTTVLDRDLVLFPASGVATVMSDEFFNTYDKTGPFYSNYQP
ncbi:MAG TPA: hypothetical protein VMC85_13010 [Desulfomonilaceae bacterium]|nr:hypothetical protein [Desulfomonilaceae bacterium]